MLPRFWMARLVGWLSSQEGFSLTEIVQNPSSADIVAFNNCLLSQQPHKEAEGRIKNIFNWKLRI
uniref:Uncharacterized protein n=1 Tax=Picea sitchensis TaxID=3332 RepID=A0A6B9XV04_PICSI|nr:hypothetical protein Q903MT_gene6814 [Picea sitchensis]